MKRAIFEDTNRKDRHQTVDNPIDGQHAVTAPSFPYRMLNLLVSALRGGANKRGRRTGQQVDAQHAVTAPALPEEDVSKTAV